MLLQKLDLNRDSRPDSVSRLSNLSSEPESPISRFDRTHSTRGHILNSNQSLTLSRSPDLKLDLNLTPSKIYMNSDETSSLHDHHSDTPKTMSSMFSNFESQSSTTNTNSNLHSHGFSNSSSHISIPGLPTISSTTSTNKSLSPLTQSNIYFPLFSSATTTNNAPNTTTSHSNLHHAPSTSNHSLTTTVTTAKSEQSYSPASSLPESNVNIAASTSFSKSYHIGPHGGGPPHPGNSYSGQQMHGHLPSSHTGIGLPVQHHGQHRANLPSDQHSHNHAHQHHGHNDLTNAMQSMHMGPVDPLDQVLGAFPGVRVRNLPYDANIEDILILFHGLVMLDIVVMGNPYGQGPGEAFVVFQNPMDFSMALQRNRQSMRHGSFVEIFQGKRADYHTVITAQYMQMEQQGQGDGHRSQLQGQENTWSTQGDALNVHANAPSQSLRNNSHNLPHTHMHQGSNVDGSGSPGGYKVPANAGVGGQNALSGPYKGARPGRGEARSKGTGGRGSGRGGGIQVGDHTGYLRMRGLPFTATKEEIFVFFAEYNPVETSICLTYRGDGRATGEGYIAFDTPDNAKEAMTLHRNTMGSRYIELFISNKEEHGRAQAREP